MRTGKVREHSRPGTNQVNLEAWQSHSDYRIFLDVFVLAKGSRAEINVYLRHKIW